MSGSTLPIGGTLVDPNSAVDLVVSSGPASVSVPTTDYLQFDGVDDVVVADDASLDISDAITLEAWIRPDTLSNSKAQDRIIHKTTDYELTVSTGDRGCLIGTNGDVQWRATIGGKNRRICGGVLTPGVWHHLAGTYDGSQVVSYVDGAAVASAARSGSIASNASPLYLGNRSDASRAFDGSLDEVRIWNRAFSATEIATNRSVELSDAEPGLVAYFRLNDGGGQVASDTTVLGNNGVLGSTSDIEANDPQWASTSSPQVSVPNVVNLPQADAEAAIVAANLVVGTVTTATNDEFAAGLVISQLPVSGTLVEADSAVDLVVSLGAAP